jgi:bla regulator protein BlaR1
VSRRRPGLAVAGASSSCSMLKRRIAMLRDSSPSTVARRVLSVAVIAAAVAAAVPLRLTARAQAPAAADQPGATADKAPDWANTHLSRIWLGPGRAWLSGGTHESLLPAGGEEPKSRDLNYVLFLDDHNTNMSGSPADIDRARRFRRGGERLLWFRRNGVEYVVRDAQLIDQVLQIWKPVGELGDAQGELGTKQGALGTQQGVLGTQQGVFGTQQGILGTKQGMIGQRQAVLSAREQTAKNDGERRALDDARRQLETEMGALESQMRALDVKMRDLDQPMRDLDKEMRVLGAQMEALGRQMEEASHRAEQQMVGLIDRAIATGLAERVNPVPQALQSNSPLERLSRLNRLSRLGRVERLDRLTRLNQLFDWL